MLVKIMWRQSNGRIEWEREGWYLLGFIPLYVRDVHPRKRVEGWLSMISVTT